MYSSSRAARYRNDSGEGSVATVSVIIPAYNCAEFISETLESVLGQTYQDFEIIVIDDCSKDNTWEIICRYAKSDSRIHAFKNDTNLGIAGNRNRGISLSSGKYIAWQDADDISLPMRLEHQVSFMEKNESVGIVGGYLEIFRCDQILGIRKYAETDKDLRRCIFRYSPVAQPSAMLRKSALDRVGPYDLRYPPAEDLDMTFRIGRFYELANLPEVLIRYRESDASATFTRLRKIELSTLAIRWKNFWFSEYQATVVDLVYNIVHFFSIWLIPTKIKIKIFNYFRNAGIE